MTRAAVYSLAAVSAITVLLMLPTQAVAADAESGQLEEVVVTAQKRIEDLQKASLALDALSPDDIASQGITNAIDLQEILPTVRFVAADQMTVLIRGLGTVNDNPGVDSAVGYSQDGIYLSHPMALTPVLFDLKRVEALRGPQGTLYGRNTNAGIINFITNDPGPELGGYARIGAGNYSAISSEAAINIPLGSAWALRIAGGSEKHDPYDKDGSNDVDAYAGRAKLQYSPDDNLRVLLAVEGADRRSAGNTYGGLCPPGNIAPGCVGLPFDEYSGLLPASQSVFNNNSIFGTALTVDYDLGWGNLTSLSGYKSHNFRVNVGPSWFGGTNNFEYLHPEKSRFFTQEVRLASPAESKIGWVGGVYYSHESQPSNVQFNYRNTVLQAFFGVPPNFYQKLTIVDSSYKSEAVFGDVTVPFGTALRFRGGLRYTHESKDITGTEESGILGGPVFPGGPPNVSSTSISKVTWKAGLDYDVTPSSLLYLTVSTGFKSGGVNNLPTSVGLSTYEPETITAYELGSKNRFLDERLQINASLFYYDYEGYQTFTFYQPTAGPFAGATLFPTVNSQTATFKGGEIQAVWALTPADRLGVDVNFLHNRFDEFVIALPFAPVQNLSDTEVPLSPKVIYGLNYEHRFRIGDGGVLSVGLNSDWVASHIVSGNQGATTGNALYTQSSYHKSGANLTLQTPTGGWTISAFIRNIENEATINTIAGGYPTLENLNLVNVMLDPPRTYGLSVRKDF